MTDQITLDPDLAFEVAGVPQPQGSKTRGKFGNIRDDNDRLAPWRYAVADAARAAIADVPGYPLTDPVELSVWFYFARPRSHYGTGRNADQLRPGAPGRWHAQKPDDDKLVRAVCDSLTAAGVVRDDALISRVRAEKLWNTAAFAVVEVCRLA